ncbi:hypothetical protein TRFO_06076 [Tritrichomonas foetus]|uniref:Uncharacterized protein n=1 Tax=Tritrichomonas foetus TaxID=1144522 RepID=A0A1J4K1G0_9EUKA|nr:hypothetical protein TRFO_06076 [Tritrichomonas foetus]|eukprot:OHT05075.1 hypothetical protein TRFO_06076 [Tritrichomonas foetus]
MNLNQPIILTNKKTQVKVKSQSNEILITEDNDEENAKDYEIFHSPIRKSSEKKPKSFNKSYLSKPRNTNHDSDFSFSMSSSAQGETPEEIAERARWKIKKLFTFDSDNSDNIELDRKLSKTDNVDRHRRNTRKLSVDTSTRKRGSSQIDVDPDDKMNNTSISRRKRKNENSNKRSSRKHTKSRRHSTHNHRDFSENSIDKNDYTSEYDNDFEDELERVYSKSRHIDDIPVNKASINDIQKSDNRNTGGRPKLQISSNLQDDEPRNKGKEKPLKLAISGDLVKLDEIKEKIKPKLKICNYIVAADQPFTLSESSEFLSPAYIAPTMEPYKPSLFFSKTRTTPHNEISSKTSHQTEKLYETPKIKNESNLELFSSEPTLSEGSSDQTSNVPKHKSSQNKEFRYLSESSSSSAAVDQIIYSSDTYRRRRAASTKRKKRKADKLAETANPVSPSSFFTPIQDNNAENPHDNKKHQENRKKFGDVVSKARDKLNKTVKVTPKSKNERKYRKMFKPMNDLLSDSSVEKQIRRRREKQKKLFNEKPEKNSIIINEKETAQTKDKVKGNIQEKNDSKNVEPHSPLRSTIHQRSSRPNKTTPPKLNLPDSDNRILKEFNKSFELENKQPPSPIERIGDIDVSSSSIMDIPGDSPRGIRKKALFDTDESIENIFNSDSNLQSPTKTTKKPNNRGNTPCKTPLFFCKNAGQAPNNETRKDISPTKPIEMPIKRRPTPKFFFSPVNGNLETEITQKELTLQDNQRKELRIQSSDIKENNEDKIDFDENKNEIIDKSSLHKSPPRTNLINSSPMLRKHIQIDLHSEEEMSSNLSEKPNTQPCSPISQIVPESSKTVLTSQIKASTPPISPTQLLKGNMNRPQSKFTSQKMRIQTLNHRRNQKIFF